jgi:hypothetical protein
MGVRRRFGRQREGETMKARSKFAWCLLLTGLTLLVLVRVSDLSAREVNTTNVFGAFYFSGIGDGKQIKIKGQDNMVAFIVKDNGEHPIFLEAWDPDGNKLELPEGRGLAGRVDRFVVFDLPKRGTYTIEITVGPDSRKLEQARFYYFTCYEGVDR